MQTNHVYVLLSRLELYSKADWWTTDPLNSEIAPGHQFVCVFDCVRRPIWACVQITAMFQLMLNAPSPHTLERITASQGNNLVRHMHMSSIAEESVPNSGIDDRNAPMATIGFRRIRSHMVNVHDEQNETRPFVVLVSGAPGSGKTSLGWELSRALHVPFLSRDDIKTGLHVTHYSDNPAETLRFSIRAFETFFGTAQSLLDAGVSMVIEAAFHAGVSEPSIAELASHADIAHIALTTDPATALHRYLGRALAGLRHPAHDDIRYADEMASGRKDVGVYQLDIPYPTLLVNGADGWNPPLTEMAEFVRQNRNKK
jgi:predicted kinase